MENQEALDIWDELAQEQSDPFEGVTSTEDDALEKIKGELAQILDRRDAREIKKSNGATLAQITALVKSEIAKIKPTQNVIERTIEKKIYEPLHIEPRVIKAPPTPPQIIKEIRVEVEKKDPTKYAEAETVEKLTKELEELKKRHQDLLEALPHMHGGSGVIGIPPPEGNPDNYVLTKVNGVAKWAVATGGSGGGNPFTEVDFGDITQNGTWIIIPVGNDLSFQRRESGVFVEKFSMTAV
jgi:hypothetical protein